MALIERCQQCSHPVAVGSQAETIFGEPEIIVCETCHDGDDDHEGVVVRERAEGGRRL